MVRDYIKCKNGKTIFYILLVLFVISLVACSQIGIKSEQHSEEQISEKKTEGRILVTKYMAHISKGEIKEADTFFFQKNAPEIINSSNLGNNDGGSPHLPWSSILYDKNMRLTKIVDEKMGDESTQVYALLEDSKTPNVYISAIFYLEKEGGNLFIKDIKMTPGKVN